MRLEGLLELMAAHRSVRRFEPRPLDEELVSRSVAAARLASTSSNVQGYSLLQVTDPAQRAELRVLCGDQEQVERAGAFFVVSADQRRHRLIAEDAGRAFAPNLESFLVCVIDAALFAQNLVLAFESQGLGCCYIGGLRNRLPEADRLLELPRDVFPLFGLCAGEPAEDPAPRPRLAPEALWYRDRYPDDEGLRAAIREYDRRMADWYAARGLVGRDWSGSIWRKFAKPAREQLFAFFTSKGARLE